MRRNRIKNRNHSCVVVVVVVLVWNLMHFEKGRRRRVRRRHSRLGLGKSWIRRKTEVASFLLTVICLTACLAGGEVYNRAGWNGKSWSLTQIKAVSVAILY